MSASRAWDPIGRERDFRWRGKRLARSEVLVDVAVVVALAQPLASLGAAAMRPAGSRDLAHAFAVAALAAGLGACWRAHYLFHRRFALDDRATSALGLALGVALLAFALPFQTALERAAQGLLNTAAAPRPQQSAGGPAIVAGLGVAAVCGTFAALYRRAWCAQWQLDLDSVERVLTKARMHGWAAGACAGVAAAAMAAVSPIGSAAVYAGLVALLGAHARVTARTVELYRGRVPGVHAAPRRTALTARSRTRARSTGSS